MSALSKVLAARADTPIPLPQPVGSQRHVGTSSPEPVDIDDPLKALQKIRDIASKNAKSGGSISIAYGKLEGDPISTERTVQDVTAQSSGARLRKMPIEVQHVSKDEEYSLEYDRNLFTQTVLLAVNAQVKSEFQNLAKKEGAGRDDPTQNQPKLSESDKQKLLGLKIRSDRLMNFFNTKFPSDSASFPVENVLAFTTFLENEGILQAAAPSSDAPTQTDTEASGGEKSPSAEQKALTPGLSDASSSTKSSPQGSPTSTRDSQASSPERRLSSHRPAPPPPASPERQASLPPAKPPRSFEEGGKPESLASPSTSASSTPASSHRAAPLPPAKPPRSFEEGGKPKASPPRAHQHLRRPPLRTEQHLCHLRNPGKPEIPLPEHTSIFAARLFAQSSTSATCETSKVV